MVARIKKNDKVQVISGKDKGKQGVVLAIKPKKGLVLVKGVALVTRHVKPRRAGETGGIKKEESFIKIAKVMPVCPVTNKATRVASKQLENGKRVRISVRSKETF